LKCSDCPSDDAVCPVSGSACELSVQEYSRLALRTAPGADLLAQRSDDNEPVTITRRQYRLLLGAIGLCGEAGEVAELVKKHVFHDHPWTEESQTKLKKELGDVAWYHNYLSVRGALTSLGHVLWTNIQKLAARYPEGFFSSERSLNRKPGDN